MADTALTDVRLQAAALRDMGIAAARAGQRTRAQRYLHRSIALEADEEEPWLWLADLAAVPLAGAFYLRHALAINPRNRQARARLHQLEHRLNAGGETASAPAVVAERIPSLVRVPTLGRLGSRSRYLSELWVAVGCLLAIGLAQVLAAWSQPTLRFALLGLILLSLFFVGAFGRADRVRRLCLLLTLLPLHHLVSGCIPAGALDPLARYLIVTGVLLVPAFLLIYDLALRPAHVGLGSGIDPFSLLVYLLVALAGLLSTLIEPYILTPSPIVIPPASASAIAVVLLMALIALKELTPPLKGQWRTFRRVLNVAVVPLLIAFLVTAGIRLSGTLAR